MACFLVPTAEAVVTTIVQKHVGKSAKEEKREIQNPFAKRLGLLNRMLWGGSALLAFEHIWHGEITPWFPFLTNAVSPVDRTEMFREMATLGTAMAFLVTLVWVGMVIVCHAAEKKEARAKEGKAL